MNLVGERAPDFEADCLEQGKARALTLSEYAGRYVVLFFYPNNYTYICPTELAGFASQIEEFNRLDTQLLSCSVDNVKAHLHWTKMEDGIGAMPYPMIGDDKREVANLYGILDKGRNVAKRALFVIDPDGIVRAQIVNDMDIGRNLHEVVRIIHALKHKQASGEICPANWEPGQPGLKEKETT